MPIDLFHHMSGLESVIFNYNIKVTHYTQDVNVHLTQNATKVIIHLTQNVRKSMGEFNQQKYINEYTKEKYDRISINVKKGKRKEIENHYKKNGYQSMNSYINYLIDQDMAQTTEE